MMKRKLYLLPSWLSLAAALLVLLPAVCVSGQAKPEATLPETAAPSKSPAAGTGQTAPAKAVPAESAAPTATPPDRAQAG